MQMLYSLFLIIVFSALLQANDDMLEDSLEDIMSMETELKADIGSRSGSRDFLNSNAPVDVITSNQIDASGLTSLVDVLRYFVAGFNAPETSVADGSDHVRAYTLRGMNSDQILVLINGKRVHVSSMLHVNGTIGRGSNHVDLDTIALKSIEEIEILRDGAAAQYGSDAIAGVINIKLKGSGYDNSISVNIGQRAKGDGTQLSTDAFVTLPFKYDGFINLTMQAKQEDRTKHSGDGITHVGIPDSKSFITMLNSEIVLKDDTLLYSSAIFNYRDSESSAFYRDANTTHQGFLPLLNAKIVDYTIVFGAKGELNNGYFVDLSNVYGNNNIHYRLNDSMNYSQNISSLSSYDNGELISTQNITNLDIKKAFKNFNFAAGLEYRHESYEIKSGENSSYTGTGSQGFPGYKPENEVDASRNSYAIYLDSTYNLLENFSAETALRYENFSDFGTTTNIKLALAYGITTDILLRTSVSTGFRAPSMAQSHYSYTSTQGGKVVALASPNSALAQEHSAQDLKAEKSKHLTVGGVYKMNDSTFFMLDYFYIEVDDKIMLSNPFEHTSSTQIDQVAYFTNAINTKTQGIDIKFQTKHTFNNSSLLNFSIWFNYAKNEVIGFNDLSTTRENSLEEINKIENGQPKNSLKILTSYTYKNIESTLNINRFGKYSQVIDNVSYEFNPAWTVDLDVNYKVTDSFNLAIGGNNIFDEVPNKWNGLSGHYYGYDGIKPYSRYSPFGYSGAYYYIRASYKF